MKAALAIMICAVFVVLALWHFRMALVGATRVRGSRFAKLDTWVYSPLCLILAVGVALILTSCSPGSDNRALAIVAQAKEATGGKAWDEIAIHCPSSTWRPERAQA